MDTKHYTRAMGNCTKADQVDAELMARFITQTLTRSQAIVGLGPVVAVQLLFQDYRFRDWSTAAVWVIIARKISRDAWSIHHYKSTFEPERVIKNA